MGDNLDGHVLEHLREIEEAAEEVLSEKQEIVDLDRKRNQNREAIRALRSVRLWNFKDGGS